MALGNCELEELSVATEAEIHLSSGNLSLKRSTIANLSSTNNLGTFDFSGILNGYADIDMDLGSLTMTIDVPKNDIAYSIDSDLGSNTFNGRSLGLSARQNVDSPKLTLDISTNLGSVDIRTD
jgi:hypothetical protein